MSPQAPLASSPALSPAAAEVVFPPRKRCDFVIHYLDTVFLVHKLTLHLHSAYFRVLFDSLPPATTSSDRSSDCRHPHVVHCVHIPTQQEPISGGMITTDDFRLLLCHLYYPAHYRYPPLMPHDDVDVSDEQSFELHSVDYPPLVQAELRLHPESGQGGGKPRTHHEPGKVLFAGGILALAHYFDCQRLLQRCEQVALLMLSDGYAQNAWHDLRDADQYQLQAWKQRCLQLIAADRDILIRPQYAEAKEEWDRRLLMDVTDAVAAQLAKLQAA